MHNLMMWKNALLSRKMWDKLAQIYGGDENGMRANVEILREICDDMRIKLVETIAQYYGWIKEVVSCIRGEDGDIFDDTLIEDFTSYSW